jgi:hypothetical protein
VRSFEGGDFGDGSDSGSTASVSLRSGLTERAMFFQSARSSSLN